MVSCSEQKEFLKLSTITNFAHYSSYLKMSAGAVDGFVRDAEQFDDLTMMCIEYKKILHNEKKARID